MLTKKQARWSKVCQHFTCSPLFLTLIFCSSFFSDWDLVFADDERESNPTSFKFMQMAHAWKQAQKGVSGTSGTGASKLLSGFTPANAKEEKSDKSEDDDSDEDGEATSERVQRPGGGDDDEDVSSSEDDDED
jgi:crooked neck